MDYNKPLCYRDLDYNSVAIDPSIALAESRAGRLVGIQAEELIVGSVQGVGYTEKRANADGRDASDVTLDSRRIIVVGTIYGEDAADAHDRFQQVCANANPTRAYDESPGDYGYLPLSWWEPTNDSRFTADADGNRWRTVFINARPIVVPERRWSRDHSGGKAANGFAIPFTAYWEAKDPRVYLDPYTQYNLQRATAGSITGTFLHRGDYPAPLQVLLVVGSAAAAGTVTVTAGGSVMVITIPNSSVEQVIRYNGDLKVLTVTENNVEVQRQDLLSFSTALEHPQIVPTIGEDEASWTVVTTVALGVGSRLWFHEAYA